MWWKIQQISSTVISALTHFPGGRNPWGLMIWFSLLVTVLALLVIRITVKTDRARRVRNRALAHLMEFRLYQHEWTSVGRIMGRMIAATIRYLILWLSPLAALLILLLPLFAQAALRFEYRPFNVGEKAYVKVVLRNAEDVPQLSLDLPEAGALKADGEPFRSVSEGVVIWRLRIEGRGLALAHIVLGEMATGLVLNTGENVAAVSRLRVAADRMRWDTVLHDAPLPADSPVAQISVDYPRRIWRVGNVRIHWLLACFMLCMGLGLALKPVFGVEF